MSAALPDDLERTLAELGAAVRRDHERRRQRAMLLVMSLLAAAVVTAGALVAAFETIGGDGSGTRPGGADVPAPGPAEPPAPQATPTAAEEPVDTPGVAEWTGDPTAAIGQFSTFARSSIRPDEEPAAVRAAFPGAASFPRGLPYRVIGPEEQGLRQVVAVAHADGYCVGDRLGGARCGVPLALGDTALGVLGLVTRTADGSTAVLSGLVSDAVVGVEVELAGEWRSLAVAENAYWGVLRDPGVERLEQEQRLRLTLADDRVLVLPDDLGAPIEPTGETSPPAESVAAPPLEPAPGPADAIEQFAAFARSAVRPDEEPAAARAAFPGTAEAPGEAPFRVLGPREQGLRQVVAMAYEDGFCVGDRLGAWRCGVPLVLGETALGLVGAISFTADGETAVLSGLVSDAVTGVEVELDGAWLPLAVAENAYWGTVQGRGIEGLAHEHRLRLTLADGRVVTIPDDLSEPAVGESAVAAENDGWSAYPGTPEVLASAFPALRAEAPEVEIEGARSVLAGDPEDVAIASTLARRVAGPDQANGMVFAGVTEDSRICLGSLPDGRICGTPLVTADDAQAVASPTYVQAIERSWRVLALVADPVVEASVRLDRRWVPLTIEAGVATATGAIGEGASGAPELGGLRVTLDDGRVVTSG